MDLHTDIELQGELLLVTVRGSFAFDAALRLFKQACDTAAEKQVAKVLVNGLAVDGELSTFERFRLGVEMAAYAGRRQMYKRLAFVVKPPAMDGFSVLVARNRGLNAEVFSSQQEALNWLAASPG